MIKFKSPKPVKISKLFFTGINGCPLVGGNQCHSQHEYKQVNTISSGGYQTGYCIQNKPGPNNNYGYRQELYVYFYLHSYEFNQTLAPSVQFLQISIWFLWLSTCCRKAW